MKSKTYDINVLIVVIILFLLAACFGCEEEPEYTRTELEWPIHDLDGLVIILCQRNNIDYKDSWIISCPICKPEPFIDKPYGDIRPYPYGAYYKKCRNGDSIIYGFLCMPTEPEVKIICNDGFEYYETRLSCSYCEHPLGLDWKMIDLTLIGE